MFANISVATLAFHGALFLRCVVFPNVNKRQVTNIHMRLKH